MYDLGNELQSIKNDMIKIVEQTTHFTPSLIAHTQELVQV